MTWNDFACLIVMISLAVNIQLLLENNRQKQFFTFFFIKCDQFEWIFNVIWEKIGFLSDLFQIQCVIYALFTTRNALILLFKTVDTILLKNLQVIWTFS